MENRVPAQRPLFGLFYNGHNNTPGRDSKKNASNDKDRALRREDEEARDPFGMLSQLTQRTDQLPKHENPHVPSLPSPTPWNPFRQPKPRSVVSPSQGIEAVPTQSELLIIRRPRGPALPVSHPPPPIPRPTDPIGEERGSPPTANGLHKRQPTFFGDYTPSQGLDGSESEEQGSDEEEEGGRGARVWRKRVTFRALQDLTPPSIPLASPLPSPASSIPLAAPPVPPLPKQHDHLLPRSPSLAPHTSGGQYDYEGGGGLEDEDEPPPPSCSPGRLAEEEEERDPQPPVRRPGPSQGALQFPKAPASKALPLFQADARPARPPAPSSQTTRGALPPLKQPTKRKGKGRGAKGRAAPLLLMPDPFGLRHRHVPDRIEAPEPGDAGDGEERKPRVTQAAPIPAPPSRIVPERRQRTKGLLTFPSDPHPLPLEDEEEEEEAISGSSEGEDGGGRRRTALLDLGPRDVRRALGGATTSGRAQQRAARQFRGVVDRTEDGQGSQDVQGKGAARQRKRQGKGKEDGAPVARANLTLAPSDGVLPAKPPALSLGNQKAVARAVEAAGGGFGVDDAVSSPPAGPLLPLETEPYYSQGPPSDSPTAKPGLLAAPGQEQVHATPLGGGRGLDEEGYMGATPTSPAPTTVVKGRTAPRSRPLNPNATPFVPETVFTEGERMETTPTPVLVRRQTGSSDGGGAGRDLAAPLGLLFERMSVTPKGQPQGSRGSEGGGSSEAESEEEAGEGGSPMATLALAHELRRDSQEAPSPPPLLSAEPLLDRRRSPSPPPRPSGSVPMDPEFSFLPASALAEPPASLSPFNLPDPDQRAAFLPRGSGGATSLCPSSAGEYIARGVGSGRWITPTEPLGLGEGLLRTQPAEELEGGEGLGVVEEVGREEYTMASPSQHGLSQEQLLSIEKEASQPGSTARAHTSASPDRPLEEDEDGLPLLPPPGQQHQEQHRQLFALPTRYHGHRLSPLAEEPHGHATQGHKAMAAFSLGPETPVSPLPNPAQIRNEPPLLLPTSNGPPLPATAVTTNSPPPPLPPSRPAASAIVRQEEASAPSASYVFRIFAKQKDALDFLATYERQAVRLSQLARGNEGEGPGGEDELDDATSSPRRGGHEVRSQQFPSALAAASLGVRCYCEEHPISGTRRFLVASDASIWRYLSLLPPPTRHLYECIPEGRPCHLYLDLEYDRASNPGTEGDRMVLELIQAMRGELAQRTGRGGGKTVRAEDIRIVELDSSTPVKFSRHVVFLVPGWTFAHNGTAGEFVRFFLSDPTNYDRFKVLKAVTSEPGRQAFTDTPIVDLAVYSRNRHMRTALSSKFGKPAAFLPTARFHVTHKAGLKVVFFSSLVSTPAGGGAPRGKRHFLSALPPGPTNALGQLLTTRIGGGAGPRLGRAGSAASGLLMGAGRNPAVPTTSNTATFGGGMRGNHGSLPRALGVAPAFLDPSFETLLAEFIAKVAKDRAGGLPVTVRMPLSWQTEALVTLPLDGPGGHWCEAKGACHLSNYTYYTVNLASGSYAHKCFDEDHKNWRSAPMPLQEEIMLAYQAARDAAL